jgi:hypothetical protein
MTFLREKKKNLLLSLSAQNFWNFDLLFLGFFFLNMVLIKSGNPRRAFFNLDGCDVFEVYPAHLVPLDTGR